jgi:hypothetical protein
MRRSIPARGSAIPIPANATSAHTGRRQLHDVRRVLRKGHEDHTCDQAQTGPDGQDPGSDHGVAEPDTGDNHHRSMDDDG